MTYCRRARSAARLGALVVVALLAAFAGVARAGSDQSLSIEGVTIRVRAPWPDVVNRGALPLLFDARNASSDRKVVSLELISDGWGTGATALETTLALEPGAATSFELFAPAKATTASMYRLVARCDGAVETLGATGSLTQPEPYARNVLVVSGGASTPADSKAWTTALCDEARPRHPDWDAGSGGPTGFVAGGAVRRKVEGVRATVVAHQDLPTRYEGYTSIDAVVIDARDGAPRGEAFAPIAQYARTGGIVMFAGRGAEALARASAEFAPWLEDRFLVESVDGVRTWVCAQGLVMVSASQAPFEREADARQLNASLECGTPGSTGPSWIPSPIQDRSDEVVVALPGLQLPYRTLMGVLILFAILIGPVNFWFVRRSRKPALLLVTVPVIALVFSVGLFAYGAVAQGLDARATSSTFTLLDQRTHRSSSVERRQIFVGLAGAEGLRPGAGASVWLEPIQNGVGSSETRATLRFDSGVLLSGAYLPVRTPTNQTLITDRASRVRVDVRREGDGWIVQNGLGAEMTQFLVRLPDGSLWSANGSVAAGARAALSPAPSGTSTESVADVLARRPGTDVVHDPLPVGTYAARLTRNTFGDDMGVPMRQLDGPHVLLGILDPEELR